MDRHLSKCGWGSFITRCAHTHNHFFVSDPQDIAKDLEVCKAVLVDVSASQPLVEEFIGKFELSSKPLILVASDCGTNDRKKDLALRVIHDCGPNFITGKVVDIYTLATALAEKCKSLSGIHSEYIA